MLDPASVPLAVSDTVVSCWVALLTGLGVAAVCASVLPGVRRFRRQRDDGRGPAAALTMGLIVAWVVVGLVAVTVVAAMLLPRPG